MMYIGLHILPYLCFLKRLLKLFFCLRMVFSNQWFLFHKRNLKKVLVFVTIISIYWHQSSPVNWGTIISRAISNVTFHFFCFYPKDKHSWISSMTKLLRRCPVFQDIYPKLVEAFVQYVPHDIFPHQYVQLVCAQLLPYGEDDILPRP